MEFDGYDWCELAQHLDVEGYKPHELDDEFLMNTKTFLQTIQYDEVARKPVVDAIKCFVTALHNRCQESIRWSTPMWKSFLKLEDEVTIIKYTIALIEYMWF